MASPLNGSLTPVWRRVYFGQAGAPGRRELQLLAAAIVLGLVVRIAYVIAMRDHELLNDEHYYDLAGHLARDGHWFWGTAPYGNPHPTFWKTPGYPFFLGVAYNILGGATKVQLAQACLQPLTIGLTWLLARRLFPNPRIALASAFVVAVYPFAWQYTTLLYPESLAMPAVLLLLVIGLDRTPTPRRAAALGLATGLVVLIRPNAFVFLFALLAGWLIAQPGRRTLRHGAVAVGLSVVCLVPWTIRNYDISGGAFVPLSVQDGAISGVFNDDAANDNISPWAWRPVPSRDVDIFETPRSDAQVLHDLRSRGLEYIRDHPSSIPKAFFWNGITRFWDLRRPRHVTNDIVTYEGGVKWVTLVGLGMYWLMLPFALLGLWRLRERRAVFVPLVLIGALLSLSTTVGSGTRYRSTLEPLIVMLAVSALGHPRKPLNPAER